MARSILFIGLFWLGSLACQVRASGYLHAAGVTNLDINNNPIVLRGVNLGSWLWPEYYMMGNPNLSSYADVGTGSGGIANYYDGLVAAIQDLMGGDTNLTAKVLDAYWTNFISAADITYLHSQGFNSVRVPFDFEEFFQVTNWAANYPTNGYDINTGFKYLDNLVGWCSTNNIYVILDFHCPPGGPNNFSVTNYGGTFNTNTASVFASAANLALAGHIWARIAAHYATNAWIGGYDLLNEPVNTSLGGQVGSPTLSNTYSNLVKAIRAVDTNHMLICEGDYYGSTLYDVANTGWTDPGANLSFSDHDYGSTLPLGIGNRAIAVGAHVPDWAGEFGINSTRWYNRMLATTYEQPTTLTANGRTATIVQGHCFWAYKSCQFYTVVQNPQTAGWNRLKAYWASGNTLPKPSVTNAYTWLVGYAQAASFTNCLTHPEVVDSLMRPGTTAQSSGFAQLAVPYRIGVTIPGKVFAVDYDMGDSNVAYVDIVAEDQANHGPSGTAWNNGWFGRDDGVDTTTCNDPGTALKVGWNAAGEWQRHTVACTPGNYDVYIRYAGGVSGGQLGLSLLVLNGTNAPAVLSSNNISGTLTLPSTGSYSSYATYLVNNVTVTNSGLATLQVDVITPGYDLLWLEFMPAGGPPLPPIGETIVGAQPGLAAGLAVVAGNGEVSLNWVAAESATSYNVKRGTTSGGPYTTIASIPSLSYLDTGLTNGVAYYYAVSAVNANGEGANSTQVNTTPHPTTLPSPWMDQDVGVATLWSGDVADVGWAGTASFSGVTYKVTGSGVDIWNSVDSCHYLYRAISGDCTNIVRVSSLQNTDPWAKAGLMLRESFNPDAVNVLMAMTSQNGALFSWRAATGGGSTSAGQSGVVAPYWIKLIRKGNTFSGFSSADGSNWIQVGSTAVPMAASIFVGLAVTAHNNTLTNTSTFDSVSVLRQLPLSPSGLTASLWNVQAQLGWSASSNAISYNVKRASASNGVYSTVGSSIISTNFLDASVMPGMTYYYVVTAVNANGESANSNPAAVLVTLPTLAAIFSDNNLALSWPASAPGFSLYATANLAPPIIWSPVTNQALIQADKLVVTVPLNGAGQFYRLRMP
jgi:aryl-phospho-beta-D-glucosidase BglC (GH1 family)